MDCIIPEKRKNKNDWKAKVRFNKYKKGGFHRTQNIAFKKNEKVI
jgi:hypothetical protein